MHTKIVSAACLLLLIAGAWTAQATLIYSDSFNRSGALNGTAPDGANVSGQTWIADPGVTTDGTQAFNPDTTTGGYLPVTIAGGHLYTLQADLSSIAADDSWIAIGFSPTANSGGFLNNFNVSAGPWGLIRGDTNVASDQVFAGPATGNGFNVGPSGSNTGFHHLAVVLDTTSVQWAASWYLDNIQVGPTYVYGGSLTLNYVGFNADTDFANLGGCIQNFSFDDTVPVPEPGNLLAGLAIAVIAAVDLVRGRAGKPMAIGRS